MQPWVRPAATQAETEATSAAAIHAVKSGGFALAFCGFYLFMHTGRMGEIMAIYLHLNAPIVAGLCVIISAVALFRGGYGRFFTNPSCKPWLLLAFWLWVCSAFSYAHVPSLLLSVPYVLRFMAIPVVICTFAKTPEDVRSMIRWSAFGVVALLTQCFFAGAYSKLDDRFGIQGTSMENPNDLAFNLLWTACLMGIFLLGSGKAGKMFAGVAIPVGVFYVLKTASRANFVTVLVLVAVVFLLLPAKGKIAVAIAVPLLLGGALASLPATNRDRIFAIVVGSRVDASSAAEQAGDDHNVSGANASQAERMYLTQLAIESTFRHPVFGVGPGMFESEAADYMMRTIGKKAPWLTAHDSYLKISSETGLLGAVFYIWVILSGLALNYRIVRRTKNDPRLIVVHRSALVLLLALISYAICTFFGDLVYFYYLPVTLGLSIANALSFSDASAGPRRIAFIPASRGLVQAAG